MLNIVHDTCFLRQLKNYKKKHYNLDLFYEVVEKLAECENLPSKHKDHALSGNWQNYRECNIANDWLLIYRTTETKLILVATGSHDDLF